MSRERRLGRGLEALLGRASEVSDGPTLAETAHDGVAEQAEASSGWTDEAPPEAPADQPAAGPQDVQATGSQRLEVGRIDSNASQPRKEFDPSEMESLRDSIAAHGLLQPVVVRRLEDRYELIAGERRLRAVREAGWSEVPANVVEADDRETAELAIIENLQRKDLNPLEKAAAFQRYLEVYGCTQEELAGRLKLDRSTVSNLIRLLELPEEVQESIRRAKITQGHARALLPLGEDRQQIEFCGRIEREGLSVRQAERLVQETIDAEDDGTLGVIDREGKKSGRRRVPNEHVAALEQELRSALGTKVTLAHNARGRGKLVIHFRSHEEFERLRRHLTDIRPPDAHARAG